jgi:hypothetical protein
MSDPTNLEQPEEIRGPDGRRQDGRPTGEQPLDELRPGTDARSAPTEAPEEEGGEPTTEHAPGSDL